MKERVRNCDMIGLRREGNTSLKTPTYNTRVMPDLLVSEPCLTHSSASFSR